jgi:hypothetical protein
LWKQSSRGSCSSCVHRAYISSFGVRGNRGSCGNRAYKDIICIKGSTGSYGSREAEAAVVVVLTEHREAVLALEVIVAVRA